MDSDSVGGRKRRKTLVACEHCRIKKIKCDGERPVCGACAKKGWQSDKCVWKHLGVTEEPSTTGLIHGLQERIAELEKRASSNAYSPSDWGTAGLDLTNDAHGRFRPQGKSPKGVSPGGISALEGAVTGKPQDEGFIGPGSTAAFVTSVRSAVDPGKPFPGVLSASPKTPGSSKPMDYVLPPRRQANALVQAYWAYVHPLYPFLYRPSFEAAYQSLWTGDVPPKSAHPLMRLTEASSISLANLVFALGCQYSRSQYIDQPPGEGLRLAEGYFERAKATFEYDFLQGLHQSLQAVQVALLMAQYLLSTGRPSSAWEAIGLGMRASIALGIHRCATLSESNMPNAADREICKRVWYGCLMMERTLSATLGRPVLGVRTDAGSTSVPQEIDEESFQSGLCFDTARGNLLSTRSVMSFFLLSIQLSEMTQEILTSFYTDDSGILPNADRYFTGPRSIFDLDRDMMEWCDAIPSHISLQQAHKAFLDSRDTDGINSMFYRQSVVLWARYLQVRIYLFKPVLSLVCTGLGDRPSQKSLGRESSLKHGTLGQRTSVQCSVLCVKSAIELIELMHDHQTTAEAWGQKPTWLHGVLHVYLAATVLLAARLAPSLLLAEASPDRVQIAWNKALAVLRGFQADSVSAHRCVAALELLYHKLPAAGFTRDQPEISEFLTHGGTTNQGIQGTLGSEVIEDYPPFFDNSGNTTDDATSWLHTFDLSDPYEMSWFMAPEFDIA